MSINETVLEMHFHSALLDVFRTTLGLGPGAFNFYKYSPQRECFVGFDQAFVQTDLSEEALFQRLRLSAMTAGYQLSNFFVGYFLQYKVVKIMQKRMRHTPRVITNKPHQRVALDTTKNIKTGFSQHELLYNLNKNLGAFVYYACPMIFDRMELYKKKPDLNLLRLADVNSCPSDYSDNEKHFIYFNDENSVPVWCSEPIEGKAISPDGFVSLIKESVVREDYFQRQIELLEYLRSPLETNAIQETVRPLDLLHDSFAIIEYRSDEKA